MVLQIILADILLVARIFPRPCGDRKNTKQLVKYPRALSVKPSNKVYVSLSGLKYIVRPGTSVWPGMFDEPRVGILWQLGKGENSSRYQPPNGRTFEKQIWRTHVQSNFCVVQFRIALILSPRQFYNF